MVTHFFYDITHFDSNFFNTIHHLILKPGFLSQEYMKGRRASYLHPIKMYVFCSAIFFLFFFSLFKPSDAVEAGTSVPMDAKERAEYLVTLQDRLKKDSSNKLVQEKILRLKDSTRPFTVGDMMETESKKGFRLGFSDKDYKSFSEYDSTQKALPASDRDGWLLRLIIKRGIQIENKYKDNPDEAGTKLLEGFFHRLPYLLFVSLPLFALILRLVYIRKRKQFYFADHGVFTIHLYVFSFIVLLFVFGLDKLYDITHWKFLDTLQAFAFFGLVVYLYFAMRRFYKQGWGKTFVKFLLVSVLSLLMMVILFAGFLIFSAATI